MVTVEPDEPRILPLPSRDGGERLHIQFFATYCHVGGTYFRFHNFAMGLRQQGHDVTVYACDFDRKNKPRTEERDGVKYVIRPETWLVNLCWHACDPITMLRLWWASFPPCDVAHMFQPFPTSAIPWGHAKARLKVFDWDDLWADGIWSGPAKKWRDYWPRAMARRLERTLPARADCVTVPSQFLADLAIERGARETAVIHNGFWPRPHADRQTARTALGLRADAFYVGFMGRTVDVLSWCFDALAENLDHFPNLRMAVCGVGDIALSKMPEAIKSRVDNLGQRTSEEARDFASAIDLGLLPLADDAFNHSRFPIKFSDHLATGRPLLCSTVGECGRLVERYSWAIPAGATKVEWLAAYRSAVERLIDGEALPVDLARFDADMSWEGLTRKLTDVYRRGLAQKAAATERSGR